MNTVDGITNEDKYTAALIRKIVREERGKATSSLLDRVITALEPQAVEGTKANDPGVWDRMRELARDVLASGFDAEEYPCPKCGATFEDAELLCPSDGDCPVTEGG